MLTLSPARILVLFGFACTAGCGDGADDGPAADQAVLVAPGPYAVASKDFLFIDASRPTPRNGTYAGAPQRRLPTRVYYPTDSPAGPGASPPPSMNGAPFPIIAYAHGFLSQNGEAQALGEHLASHGYLVAAPTLPLSSGGAPGGPTLADLGNQPGDLEFVLHQVAALGGADRPIGAAADTTRQGILGLSMGGGTVLIGAYHPVLHLPDIQAAVAEAPLSCFFGRGLYAHPLPTLILSGDADELVPFSGGPARAFDLAPAPVTLLRLRGGTHVGFIGLEVPGPNSDAIGCAAVKAAKPAGQDVAEGQLTQGAGPGVIDAGGCDAAVCMQTFTQTMHATRQQELARAAVLAHFEATLRGRMDAARFLSRALGADNQDVEVRTTR